MSIVGHRPTWPQRPSVFTNDPADIFDDVLLSVLIGLLALLVVPIIVISMPVWIPLAIIGHIARKIVGADE